MFYNEVDEQNILVIKIHIIQITKTHSITANSSCLVNFKQHRTTDQSNRVDEVFLSPNEWYRYSIPPQVSFSYYFFFLFWDRVLLCSFGCPGTHKLPNPNSKICPSLPPQVLRLQACATTSLAFSIIFKLVWLKGKKKITKVMFGVKTCFASLIIHLTSAESSWTLPFMAPE